MLFNSFEFFLLYMPFVIFIYFLLGFYSKDLSSLFVGCMSLFFLGAWKIEFAVILLASVLLNYMGAYAISIQQSPRRRYIALFVCVFLNLGAIFFYKYLDFTIYSINFVFDENIELVGLILPLGISFYTFTQTAFLVDTYRNEVKDLNFVRYLLFVTYFPHLIAGPILHHGSIIPQFAKSETYRPQARNIAVGFVYFTIGLAKKVLLADLFAAYSTPVFEAADGGAAISGTAAWCGALAYTLQIYFDFSGYSDMAVGLAKMMNVDIPHNFNSPYKASSIIDFWRRWHISLSTFLRDYVYIPLGGSRRGSRYVNLLMTMLIGGLWHGANWTFVFWGGLHGLYLVINHWAGGLRLGGTTAWMPKIAGNALTLLAVVVAWVFFRAETFDGALTIVTAMLPGGCADCTTVGLSSLREMFEDLEAPWRIGISFTIGYAICWLMPNTQTIAQYAKTSAVSPFFIIGCLIILDLMLLIINASRGISEFIYFNF